MAMSRPAIWTILRLNGRRYRAAWEALAYLDGTRSKLAFLSETLRLCRPWRLQPAPPGPGLLKLRVIPLGGRNIWCRRNYSDLGVFYDTFHGRYHLPPSGFHPVSTILDLGSNIGLTVVHFAALYPEAQVLGVELDEENWRLAQKNVAQFGPRCRVLHGAVWYEPGQLRYAGARESGYSVMTPEADLPGGTAPTVTVEQLIECLGAGTVDFVKMDVEGAESRLIPRAQSWADRVRCMKVEVHPEKASPPYTLDQCKQDLERLGFTVTRDANHPACLVALRT